MDRKSCPGELHRRAERDVRRRSRGNAANAIQSGGTVSPVRCPMKDQTQIGRLLAALGILLLFALGVRGYGQSDNAVPPSLVEVYWHSSRTVVFPGITNVIVLDQEITRAQTGPDSIQFFGLERGETVALGYASSKPVSIRVRVIERPQAIVSPALLRRQAEMGQGSISSLVQSSNTGGANSVALVSSLSWSQPLGNEGHLDFISDVEDNSFAAGRAFNLRHAAAHYYSPGMDVRALDFSASLVNNGGARYLGPFSSSDLIQLRGVSVSLNRGDNQYTIFGGTTVPF